MSWNQRALTMMKRIRESAAFAIAACALASVLTISFVSSVSAHAPRWTEQERAMLRSLSLSSLEPLPADPTNRYADDERAARLGKALFFDTRLSANGKVSCATCHVPEQEFQDSKPLGNGFGTTGRRTMPVAGTAHNAWFFWDGRSDSQWSQALGPLESPVEHGGTRTQYARVIADHYRDQYQAVFGALPSLADARRTDITRIYANIGKAIAAYERRIEYAPSRFDRYVDAELSGRPHAADAALSSDEEAGLRIFIGKGSCSNCHNGALLTDQAFHNTGVPASASVAAVDSGRTTGVRNAIAGEFNCLSAYSDAKPDDCAELHYAVREGPELVRAFKTPSLRNVANRAPYMHAGQYATLDDVAAHYNAAPAAPFGHTELKPLRLSAAERRQLVAFLRTLSGPVVQR